MTHICVSISKLTTIVSHNSLSPERHQAIVWTNAGISLIGPLGTNFCEFLVETDIFSSKEMHLRMSPGKWQPFCLGLNVLIDYHQLSDIDPIDSFYMVLNNTINDSDLWQQGGFVTINRLRMWFITRNIFSFSYPCLQRDMARVHELWRFARAPASKR